MEISIIVILTKVYDSHYFTLFNLVTAPSYRLIVTVSLFLLLQRATLAEKEVSALKEQLATANQNLQLIEGKGGGGNKPPGGGGGGGGGDMEQNTMDIISRSGLEVELAAKEKEVSWCFISGQAESCDVSSTC